MKETIWLAVDQRGVNRMTKKLPSLNRGEIPIKLEVIVEPSAFTTPTLVRTVHVEDWRQGVDISDVEFKETTITEDEAALIRARRLEKMAEILTDHGFGVTVPDAPNS
jgi:hypothetical protein